MVTSLRSCQELTKDHRQPAKPFTSWGTSCLGTCSWELLGQEMVPPWVLAEQVGDHKCKGNYLSLPSSLHLYISNIPFHHPVLTPIPSQHHFLPSYSQLRPRKLHSRPPTCPLASDDTQSPWHHLIPRKE